MTDRETGFLHVAVARYADACEPPRALHPDCPYAVEGEDGRTCSEECRGVLLRLSRPGASMPTAGLIPVALFDARQHWLSENRVQPGPDWHTASLMYVLRRALGSPPVSRDSVTFLIRRNIDVTNALAYLSRRGFDPERLVREGFRELLPPQIAVWVATTYVRQQSQGTQTDISGWRSVLEDFVGSIGQPVTAGALLALIHNSEFPAYVRRWIAHAPLDDIVNWSARSDVNGEPVESDGTTLWVLERFSLTYLKEWSLESLKHEFRYARGDEIIGIPRLELTGRVVERGEVSKVLAERSVEAEDTRLNAVKRQAIFLLNEGRRLEAAALFDAVRILDPQNSEAHNNYAFCLTLDYPEAALEALRQSEKLEHSAFPLNRVNQVVVLHLLGRDGEAATLAEETFRAHEASLADESATLWEGFSDPEGPTLGHVNGLRYLCERGTEIAARLGDEQQIAIWSMRMLERD